MVWIRKILILFHRYLGIALGLLFILWFVTGIGMMWAREMPRLTPELRIERLAPIDPSRIHLTVAEAAERAGLERPPGRVVLATVMGRPAFRLGGGSAATVFADTGEVMGDIGPDDAVTIASQFLNVPAERIRPTLLTEIDQWTVAQRRALPLHKLFVDDAAQTQIYISPSSGDPVLLTTRGSRALAWIATIPHWLYFKSLTVSPDRWRQVVLWTSGIGCFLALGGIVLGIIQFKFSRLLKGEPLSACIPYAGWMRWHYLTGVVFGILTFTWVFSGWLSMEPSFWASGGGLGGEIRAALTGGPLNPFDFPAMDTASWARVIQDQPAKEIEWTRIQGGSYYLVRRAAEGPASNGRTIVSAGSLEPRNEHFSEASLMSLVKETYPDVPIVDSEILHDYDSYYYSKDREAPLPVLRVRFGDPDATWFYIDPVMSQVVGGMTHKERIQRWIYHGLHSLDFSFWYYSPVWYVGMMVLLIGGTIVSVLGFYLGILRLWRGARRMTAQ